VLKPIAAAPSPSHSTPRISVFRNTLEKTYYGLSHALAPAGQTAAPMFKFAPQANFHKTPDSSFNQICLITVGCRLSGRGVDLGQRARGEQRLEVAVKGISKPTIPTSPSCSIGLCFRRSRHLHMWDDFAFGSSRTPIRPAGSFFGCRARLASGCPGWPLLVQISAFGGRARSGPLIRLLAPVPLRLTLVPSECLFQQLAELLRGCDAVALAFHRVQGGHQLCLCRPLSSFCRAFSSSHFCRRSARFGSSGRQWTFDGITPVAEASSDGEDLLLWRFARTCHKDAPQLADLILGDVLGACLPSACASGVGWLPSIKLHLALARQRLVRY